MAKQKFKKEDCLIMLQKKYAFLQEQGETRYPCRGDFEQHEVVAIKAFLGPWPRALEAAGIKPLRPDNSQAKVEKKIQKKRAKIEWKKTHKDTEKL